MDPLHKFFDTILMGLESMNKKIETKFIDFSDWLGLTFLDPTLDQTFVEKIGGGPHGYGDPRDASIREEEQYFFPRMIWKKIRYEKCFDVIERYYACANRLETTKQSVQGCKEEEDAMFACKSHHYSEEFIDEVEKECVIDYLQLRSKFRETGSADDLWKMKMMLLEPGYDKAYQAAKEGASEQEVVELLPPKRSDHPFKFLF